MDTSPQTIPSAQDGAAIVALGIGNVLWADEGFGRALHRGAAAALRMRAERHADGRRHAGPLSDPACAGGRLPADLRCGRLRPRARRAEDRRGRRGAEVSRRAQDEPAPDRLPGSADARATDRQVSAPRGADRLPAGRDRGLRRQPASVREGGARAGAGRGRRISARVGRRAAAATHRAARRRSRHAAPSGRWRATKASARAKPTRAASATNACWCARSPRSRRHVHRAADAGRRGATPMRGASAAACDAASTPRWSGRVRRRLAAGVSRCGANGSTPHARPKSTRRSR